MGSVQVQLNNTSGLFLVAALSLNHNSNGQSAIKSYQKFQARPSKHNSIRFFRAKFITAVSTVTGGQPPVSDDTDEPPSVDFAFVHSVLLPDGTPDVHFRRACGGQKLRDIMLDSNIDLYGPYAKPLSNCGGGGTCGTCMVEVVDGEELLSPRTDSEKDKLKRKPKNWRLACQTIVGKPDSNGLVVIQQLPEWKAHEWKLQKDLPNSETDL